MINELFREVPPVPTGAEIETRCVMLGRQLFPSIDVVSYGFFLQKRKAIENKHVQDVRRWPLEGYNYFDGYYEDQYFFSERPKITNPLTAAEESLMNEVISRIGKKEGPVTLVDFGGGVGFSMIRIAASLEEEIRVGRVAIVVTNLSFLPNGHQSEAERTDIPGFIFATQPEPTVNCNVTRSYTDEELAFLDKNQHLVHFMRSTAPELFTKFVTLPNGRQYPLAGNIDVLHEMMVLPHSPVPEMMLAFLGHALADSATMRIHGVETKNKSHREQSQNGPSLNSYDYAAELDRAQLIGVAYLGKYLGLTEEVEELVLHSRYTLKGKPKNLEAPKI